jgi:hypothetical protein
VSCKVLVHLFGTLLEELFQTRLVVGARGTDDASPLAFVILVVVVVILVIAAVIGYGLDDLMRPDAGSLVELIDDLEAHIVSQEPSTITYWLGQRGAPPALVSRPK